MAEAPSTNEPSPLTVDRPKRKALISPTSSFVDFVELETEIFTPEDKLTADLYEPFQFRSMKKPTTDFETCVHLLKGSVGAGILAMPKAFYNSGVAIGIPGTIILGTICIYGIHVMLKMQYQQCKWLRVPFLTLTRSMKIAFKNGPLVFQKIYWMGPIMVDFFLVANQIGLCATYLTFIAQSFKSVMEPTVIKEMDIRLYMLILFLPVLFINYIRNLKKLMPVSLIADILVATGLAICFYYIFGTGPFKLDETKMVAKITTWPLFIGTVMFALEAVGVMIALEHNMKNPQRFLGWAGIFPWCMVFIIVMYTSLGLFGYLKYGEETGETIIASLPRDQWLAKCVQLMVALSIYGSYPLQCFVALEIIWGNYIYGFITNHEREYCIEYTLRSVIVIITFLLAMVIPHVDLVISLVGCFCLSMLGVVIPFLLELCTCWPDAYGFCYYTFIKDVLLIIFGLFVLIAGTYTTLYSIIVK